MKAFLLAFLTAFVLAGITAFVLENFQASSDRANTTSGARVDFARDGVNRTLPK
jgi:SNF family Na+-dependent transporter